MSRDEQKDSSWPRSGASVAAGAVGLTVGPAQAGEARRTTSSAQEAVVAYVADHRSGS